MHIFGVMMASPSKRFRLGITNNMYTMQLYAQAIFRQLLGLPTYITTKNELELKMASAERYAADGVLIGLTDMRMRQRQWHE